MSAIGILLSYFGLEKRELPGFGFVKRLVFRGFRLIFDRFLQICGFNIGFFDFCRFTFRFKQQVHLRYLAAHIPDAVLWSCGQQSAAVVGRCRVHECVTDDYISSAAHEAALDVAHQPNDEVNVLGDDKDFVVVADIPSFADVQKGKQRGPSTTGRSDTEMNPSMSGCSFGSNVISAMQRHTS